MHAVERRRLGRADVRADVLDRVEAERDEVAVGREAGLDAGDPPARGRARGEVLEAILDPAHRDAEFPRRETHEDDVGETADLIPKVPPESGGVIRRSLEPGSSSAAAATECSVNGPWKFAHAVSEPSAAFQSATTP